ncbi:DNA ligase [Vibrio genomosp. F10]|uniref:DNA ligase n=1 Tax=Vibrio genomosp. F10 TaxID=723171 RepID=UPI0002D8247B|nr:DNA ligase [Vibrio genomosp. F10]OEF05637.1 DNA ligase [Vibrio genomosp. F10 str. 9ZB36]
MNCYEPARIDKIVVNLVSRSLEEYVNSTDKECFVRLSVISIGICLAFSCPSYAELAYDMGVMNAHSYQSGINIEEYWQSEKLDGIRAIWTGKTLLTRKGNPINAPDWFTEALPNFALEGELWAGRGNFHLVQQTVLDKVPSDSAWEKIDYMLFDMPQSAGDYQKRYYNILHWLEHNSAPHLRYVKHKPIASEEELFRHLDNVSSDNGEGIMLRKVTSRYQAGRSNDMLKLKKHEDTEALVIGYKLGEGKYRGLMGSLRVRLESGAEFNIGSGFTDEQRRNPPQIGSTITFRYNGWTQNGIPKFARYLRERKLF